MTAKFSTSPHQLGPSTNWGNLQSVPAVKRYPAISLIRYLRHSQTRVRNHCFPFAKLRKNFKHCSSASASDAASPAAGRWTAHPGATSRRIHRVFLSFAIPRTLEKVFDSSQVGFHVAASQQNASRFEQPSHEKTPQLISQLRGPLCGGATWHVEGWPPRPSTACREVKGNPSTPTRLRPSSPESNPSQTFSNWWSEGEPSPQCTAEVDGKFSPTVILQNKEHWRENAWRITASNLKPSPTKMLEPFHSTETPGLLKMWSAPL